MKKVLFMCLTMAMITTLCTHNVLAAVALPCGDDFENAQSATGEQYAFNPDPNSIFEIPTNMGTANVKEISVVNKNGSKKVQLAYADPNKGGTVSNSNFNTKPVNFNSSIPLVLEYKMILHNLAYNNDGVTVYAVIGGTQRALLSIRKNRLNSAAFAYAAGTPENERLSDTSFIFNSDQEYTILFVMSGTNSLSIYIDGTLLSDKLILPGAVNYSASFPFRFLVTRVEERKATFDENNVPNNDYGRVYLDDARLYTPDMPNSTSISPADGSTVSFYEAKTAVFTFNNPIKNTTVANAVTAGGTPFSGASLSQDGRSLRVPLSGITGNTSYNVSVNGLSDIFGQSVPAVSTAFTARPWSIDDNVNPIDTVLTGVVPSFNGVGVSAHTDVRFTYSGTVEQATLDTAVVYVNNEPLNGSDYTLSVDTDGRTVKIVFDNSFRYGGVYTVELEGAKDTFSHIIPSKAAKFSIMSGPRDWEFSEITESSAGIATNYAITGYYNGNATADVSLAAVAYKSDGTFAEMDIHPAVAVGSGETVDLSVMVTKPAGGSVKVMLWTNFSELAALPQ